MQHKIKVIILLVSAFAAVSPLRARDTSNTISRNDFNFGHQLGYMYARMDDAWLKNGNKQHGIGFREGVS